MKIELTYGEIMSCRVLAKLRHDNNRSSGVTNAKMGNQDDEFTDLEGICGELAFCKLFNLFPDFTVGTRSSSDGSDEGDCLYKGKSIDVKVTRYPSGKLLATHWKTASVDYFALMVGVSGVYEFKGFMASGELIQPSRLGSLGHGQTYIAHQCELKPEI